MPLTIADALDYISFFTFRCNGTTVLAEMHRVIMNDRESYRVKASFGDHFYEFLFDLAVELYPEINGVGSCTQAQYTYCSGNNNTKWCDHQDELFSLCRSYFKDSKTSTTQAALRKCTNKLVNALFKDKDPLTKKKRFCRVGAMGAIQFVHIASLLGIIPLQCYNYAELIDDKLGPPRFIRVGLGKSRTQMPISECNDFLTSLHKDFSSVW